MGQILYKYFSPNRFSIFEDQLVRFTQPSGFNDPFEFYPKLLNFDHPDFIKIEYQKLMDREFFKQKKLVPELSWDEFMTKNKQHEEYHLEVLKKAAKGMYGPTQKMIPESINKSLAIFCLAEEWDNVLMWSHYADEHKGFVVGFDPSYQFFKRKNKSEELFKVHYQKTHPTVDLLSKESKNPHPLVVTKADYWQYEKEWRLVKASDKVTKVVGDNILLFKFPKSAISEVVFGLRTSVLLQNKILSNMQSDPVLKSRKVYKTDKMRDKYRLTRSRVSKPTRKSKTTLIFS